MGKVIFLKSTKERRGVLMKKPEIITSINVVAEVLLSFESMTHKKLQKLCYYAYSVLLANTGGRQKLFDERIEAWIHGPVIPNLYARYRKYNVDGVIKTKECPVEKTSSLYHYLEDVFNIFGRYTGDELEEMTHQSEPWTNARIGLDKYEYSQQEINDEDIINHFS